jgi:hypothetical protein
VFAGRPNGIAPIIVAGGGLALAIAAVTAPQQPATSDGVAKKLIFALPDWLILVVLLAFGAVALLLLLLIVRVPRRRRKSDDNYEHYYEPPKPRVIDYVLLLLLAAVPFALVGAVLWYSLRLTSSKELAGGTSSASASNPQTPSAPLQYPETVGIYSPTASAVLGTLAILVAFAALGFMLWIYFGDRLTRRSAQPLRPIRAALDAVVADSLDVLLRETDPRHAIIKCYRRMEMLLAAHAFPRPAWQTPMEFMRAVLHQYSLPHLAIWDLTRLFELARFSQHTLSSRDREIALSSLKSIKDALDNREVRNGSSK